jgi:hypothetical protein
MLPRLKMLTTITVSMSSAPSAMMTSAFGDILQILIQLEFFPET